MQKERHVLQYSIVRVLTYVFFFFSLLHRKAHAHDLAHDRGQEAGPDLGLALTHDRVASTHDHIPGHDLTRHDTDHTQSHAPGHPDTRGLGQSHVPSRVLDQDLPRSPSLDRVLGLVLDRREMKKLDLLSLEQMRTRIAIQLMATLSHSKPRRFRTLFTNKSTL